MLLGSSSNRAYLASPAIRPRFKSVKLDVKTPAQALSMENPPTKGECLSFELIDDGQSSIIYRGTKIVDHSAASGRLSNLYAKDFFVNEPKPRVYPKALEKLISSLYVPRTTGNGVAQELSHQSRFLRCSSESRKP